jgi:peptidoglycan hydrolase-like protein with peptidoglycan-binding domain
VLRFTRKRASRNNFCFSPGENFHMALSIGSSGSLVKSLQQQLLARGFDPQGVDGSFGSNTQSAVRQFQQANGLKVDGRVGSQTLQALRNRDTFTPAAGSPASRPSSPASRPSSPVSRPSSPASPVGTPSASPAAPVSSSGGPNAHVNVPWYSQFDGSHGYTPGGASCKPTSMAMAHAVGTHPTERTISGGRNMTNYIDSQLAQGKPVLGTVQHTSNHGSGAHVVVITGHGTDSQGRSYYTFNDPGTTHREMGVDTNPNNRLYVNPSTGALTRQGTNLSGPVYQQNYQLSFVRQNA